MKSIFLQTTCSKRDKGKPEVARAILGDHLVHSTFTYKTVSLDMGKKEIIPFDLSQDESQRATYKNLLEYYGERFNIRHLHDHLHDISSFIGFARKFEVVHGQLRRRSQSHNLIIITTPRVKYDTKDKNTHQDYCFYQLLKYSAWTSESLKTISKENAIVLWKEFLKNASGDTLDSIRYGFIDLK